jgi:hypothetical protein
MDKHGQTHQNIFIKNAGQLQPVVVTCNMNIFTVNALNNILLLWCQSVACQ